MVTASLAGILYLLSSYEVISIYLFALFLLAFYTLGLGLHDRCIIFAVDGSLHSAITVFVLVMCKRFACISYLTLKDNRGLVGVCFLKLLLVDFKCSITGQRSPCAEREMIINKY